MRRLFALLALLSVLIRPTDVRACACGCGVFSVGAGSTLPTQQGGMGFLEYDYMDQNRNWSGSSSASADANSDKDIRTSFVTAGAQWMYNRSWGVSMEVPYWSRQFKTDGSGSPATFSQPSIGDIRLMGLYTGFSPDMSAGLKFGLKLPTGSTTAPGFDRDTQIGTGSTDLLLGAYRMGRLPALEAWGWFADAQWDQPMLYRGEYRPGGDVNAALGAYYEGWDVGTAKLSAIGQVIASYRWADGGALANYPDSGYQRVVLAPGLELNTRSFRLFGDVGFPVYQFVNGNQLVASPLYRLMVGVRL
jgi:hypothetical protein